MKTQEQEREATKNYWAALMVDSTPMNIIEALAARIAGLEEKIAEYESNENVYGRAFAFGGIRAEATMIAGIVRAIEQRQAKQQ